MGLREKGKKTKAEVEGQHLELEREGKEDQSGCGRTAPGT